MRVMNFGTFLNGTSAVLALGVLVSLGSPPAIGAQFTNESSVSLHESTPATPPSGGPPANPVTINQENINFATQDLNVTGCAEAIDQVIVQSSLNFNLILQDFPITPLDPSQLLGSLDFSKIDPLNKVPFTIPVPTDPNAKVSNQTIVQTSININEPGATTPATIPDNIKLTVTDINGDNVTAVNQSNLNVAAQVVTAFDGYGTIDQAILQTTVDFNRTLTYSGQPLDLTSLLNGLDFLTPLRITTNHVDGPGCPTGPGAPVMDFVDQTLIQNALNFNIINRESSAGLPAVQQATDDTGVQQVNIVPEPSSLILCGMGLPWFVVIRPRSKRRRK